MKFFVRALVSGFAFTLGAALFKKLAPSLGLGEKPTEADKDKGGAEVTPPPSDPGLQHEYS